MPDSRTDPEAGSDPPDSRLARTAAQLVPVFYADLRRLARRVRHEVQGGETLHTKGLIHEVYLKLRRAGAWNDHRHFLRASAMAMRLRSR